MQQAKSFALPFGLSAAALLLSLLALPPAVRAAPDGGQRVRVSYVPDGRTELDTLRVGAKVFTNRNYTLKSIPAELDGLTFTRGEGGKPADAVLDVLADATVYVIVDSEHGANPRPALIQGMAEDGWTRLTDGEYGDVPGKRLLVAVFKRHFASAKRVSLRGPDWSGFIVAAADPALGADAVTGKPAPDNRPPPVAEAPSNAAAVAGPTTNPAGVQTSIRCLETVQQDSGILLGQASEMILTVTRGASPRLTAVRFATPVGNEMRLARDEALRFIRLTYPNWDADDAEITFEDKYSPRDGGSNGAAVGVCVLSVIRGFEIDPTVAITGDISANGKVRAIGGVAAKMRGAAEGKCAVVVIPADNEPQLTDATVYHGPRLLTDAQILGVADIDEAVAAVRADRAPKLAEALALFASVQAAAKDKPDYVKTKDARDKLSKVLELAPRHLSARGLLAIADGKQPRTLSATASMYYAFAAARPMVEILRERQASTKIRHVSSAAIRSGLADLRKLRPMADPDVRPVVDAWSRLIESWAAWQQGRGTPESVERQRLALLDEMAKRSANLDLMQRMLKEGI